MAPSALQHGLSRQPPVAGAVWTRTPGAVQPVLPVDHAFSPALRPRVIDGDAVGWTPRSMPAARRCRRP